MTFPCLENNFSFFILTVKPGIQTKKHNSLLPKYLKIYTLYHYIYFSNFINLNHTLMDQKLWQRWIKCEGHMHRNRYGLCLSCTAQTSIPERILRKVRWGTLSHHIYSKVSEKLQPAHYLKSTQNSVKYALCYISQFTTHAQITFKKSTSGTWISIKTIQIFLSILLFSKDIFCYWSWLNFHFVWEKNQQDMMGKYY